MIFRPKVISHKITEFSSEKDSESSSSFSKMKNKFKKSPKITVDQIVVSMIYRTNLFLRDESYEKVSIIDNKQMINDSE